MFFHFKQRLFQPIDIAPLVVFRILFGLLLFAESAGSIATGWVHSNFIEPQFNFAHMPFTWLEALPGNGMYFYYGTMAALAILITLGLFYRIAMTGFSILWLGCYLMQKTSYNNHYYLLVLLCFIMILVPANRFLSIDAHRKPEIKSEVAPYWTSFIFIVQILIVYTYASIAKMYPDWLDGTTIRHFFSFQSINSPAWISTSLPWLASIIESFNFMYKTPGMEYFVAYSAIAYDLLVVPGMLWKRTRKTTFILSIVFHLFNSFTFGIGIFPYLALALFIFCFDPEKVRRLFLPKKSPVIKTHSMAFLTRRHHFGFYCFAVYFLWQSLLPLRHHLFEGDVLWNEAGHKYAWRMMLRTRTGRLTIRAKIDGKFKLIHPRDFITAKQYRRLKAYPDFMWYFAQHLEKHFLSQGHKSVELYYNSWVSVNGNKKQQFIDPSTDMTKASWNYWGTQSWILPNDEGLQDEHL